MRRPALLALSLLVGCHQREAPTGGDTAGARLERAATAAGIVADPARISLVGAWARDTDRLCVVGANSGSLRVGVLVDYGEGQGCAASGIARQRGETLSVGFGGCRFDARSDGERIVFPATLPSACDSLCTGRASLSALSVDRISAAASEAAQLRATNGRALCGR
ncbi:hypothetical protein ACU5AX_01715 [Sphingomonas sp. XXL09]|uniref:hypothetical protein n=1 Tax=Sphingomonas sp. XXL09 TaxID=3457787 RepID=UPI00406BB80E